MVTLQRHKLIERFDDGSLELFDLSQDLSEKNNLADAHPERVKELEEKLNRWLSETVNK